MQAIILAAGFGRRLQPLTNKIPKSMVEVNGTPLIVNALEHLASCNISEVIIVTGHKHDVISSSLGAKYMGMTLTYVENPVYETTNNVYSLYLAKNYIHDDVLLLECDLFYRRELIETVMNGEGEASILVSRYNPETMDGTVIETDGGGKAEMLYINKHQKSGFDYTDKFKTVNVYRFTKDFMLGKFMPAIELYIKTQSVNSYYELVLGGLIYMGNSDVRIVEINENKWCEIDDIEDLKRAERKFAEA